MPMTTPNLNKILFLDIETVSQAKDYQALSPHWQSLWAEKTHYQRKEQSAEEFYPQRAAIMAEFGKVVCVSCGFFTPNASGLTLKIKSFWGKNESEILQNFAQLLNHKAKGFLLCAHNGKEFDFAYLSRRMLINGIALPAQLNTSGAKPWEVPHLDTLEMWKFGDRKNFTSLKLLAAVMNLPTPKDDIDGSQVGHVFWQDDDLERIANYCEKDVATLAQVYLKMTAHPMAAEVTLVNQHD